MFKFLIFLVFLSGSLLFMVNAFALEVEVQKESERLIDELGWETPEGTELQEQIQIVIDEVETKKKITVGLLSTDPNDIKFPDHMEEFGLDPRLISFTLTNKFQCAPTKPNNGCVIIELDREGLGTTFPEIKENARAIADKMVEPGILVYSPDFYSVDVQIKTNFDGTEREPIVQVVYTTPRQTANVLFSALSPMLISSPIVTNGGFYDYAKQLSKHTMSEFSTALIPLENETLRSVHISLSCSNAIPGFPRCDLDGNINKQITEGVVSPLDFLELENLNRSKLFEDQFLPVSSIIHVLVFSDQDLEIKSVNSNVIEKVQNLGDIQESGWFFESKSGKKIDARYIFGKDLTASKNDLIFSFGYSNDDVKVEEGGGCLIATAAFGSELSPQVQLLREIRDNTVLQTESGSAFMTGFNNFYYSFSPAIADYERENLAFKEAVKITLTPLLTSLTLLQYADIDSESEMLGYGIGIILLNIGMYFIAPAILIMKIKKLI